MGNDLCMIHGGQDCARQRESHDSLDDDADLATPGERQQHRREDGDNHRPREDLAPRRCRHGARLAQQLRQNRQLRVSWADSRYGRAQSRAAETV